MQNKSQHNWLEGLPLKFPGMARRYYRVDESSAYHNGLYQDILGGDHGRELIVVEAEDDSSAIPRQ